ncbi:hypothetical protein THIOKS1930009 [Thiocapsa sp. KS1]|nr:hypothetical protein THIOKS1930009 [Thiocapsa sp. KS1]
MLPREPILSSVGYGRVADCRSQPCERLWTGQKRT